MGFLRLPLQFSDDANGAALDAQNYFAPDMSNLDPRHPSRWIGKSGAMLLAKVAWEIGWDSAITEVKRRIAAEVSQ
jgi:hypothetical protein